MENVKDLKAPIALALILYLLIFLIRFQQGGWEIESRLFDKQREILDKEIEKVLPSPKHELLSGILLGEKKNLPGQLKLLLRDTSTLHIVVVSGQNLTLLAALVMRLSGLLTRKFAIILSLILVVFYTLLTGADVPVVRAAIMAMIAFLAQILGRESVGVWVLILVAGFMLLINPAWLFDLSFQLSFLATFGVIVIGSILSSRLGGLPQIIRENLGVAIGAQIMVTPIIASNFHQFSVVGIITNLLVVWTIPYIMFLGICFLAASFVLPILANLLALILNILLTYFIYIVQFFGNLPNSWEYVGEVGWIVWAGYYLVLAGFMVLLNYVETKDFRRS